MTCFMKYAACFFAAVALLFHEPDSAMCAFLFAILMRLEQTAANKG